MEPLFLLAREVNEGRLNQKILERVRKRLAYLESSVRRVERASGLAYPEYYVSPYLTLARSQAEYGQLGVFFARVIPSTETGRLKIFVEFSAALVMFGIKGTIDAVAAHEFTHYFELVRRIYRANIFSDTSATTLFESSYQDEERTISPSKIFSDKALVRLVAKKFKPELSDEKLVKKVQEQWIAKNLPVRIIGAEQNVVRLSANVLFNASFDQELINKIRELEEKKVEA